MKQSSQAQENLTRVLEQVENGYPQICNHQKTVTKTFTQYNLLARELVPIYIEQVISDPLRTEASFTALNVGLESPHSSTFCAGHNTKASPNNCHSKDVRPRDCAMHKIQNRKDQKH